MINKKNKPFSLFQLIQSKKSLLVVCAFLTVFFSCIFYIEDDTDTPTLSYSGGAEDVLFAEQFVAEPVVKEGYTLGTFKVEYTTMGMPTDGVENIYAATNVKRSLSMDEHSGVINFPAGFRVGYELEVRVTAKVEQAPVSTFGVAGVNPGDEVSSTFIYRVNDNKKDTDSDGIMDGMDLDIDGDNIPNVEDVNGFIAKLGKKEYH